MGSVVSLPGWWPRSPSCWEKHGLGYVLQAPGHPLVSYVSNTVLYSQLQLPELCYGFRGAARPPETRTQLCLSLIGGLKQALTLNAALWGFLEVG